MNRVGQNLEHFEGQMVNRAHRSCKELSREGEMVAKLRQARLHVGLIGQSKLDY